MVAPWLRLCAYSIHICPSISASGSAWGCARLQGRAAPREWCIWRGSQQQHDLRPRLRPRLAQATPQARRRFLLAKPSLPEGEGESAGFPPLPPLPSAAVFAARRGVTRQACCGPGLLAAAPPASAAAVASAAPDVETRDVAQDLLPEPSPGCPPTWHGHRFGQWSWVLKESASGTRYSAETH